MPDKTFLSWPFFKDRHRQLAADLDVWASANLSGIDHRNIDGTCRTLVATLGEDGWLKHSAIDPQSGGKLDVRALCLIRETLARHDGLADFSFAMRGAVALWNARATSRMAAAHPPGSGPVCLRTDRAAIRI